MLKFAVAVSIAFAVFLVGFLVYGFVEIAKGHERTGIGAAAVSFVVLGLWGGFSFILPRVDDRLAKRRASRSA